MAWNRSSENAASRVNVDATSPSRHWWYIAGAIVVLGAAVAAWWIWPTGETRRAAASTKKGLIREVTPAKRGETPRQREEKPKKTKAELDKEIIKACEARYGNDMPPGLKAHLYYKKNPPEKVYKGRLDYEFLHHTSERDIASVLLVVPGTTFVEPTVYGKSFDDDFIAALMEPIKVEKDDSEEVRQQKELVQQLKKEIAALVRETGKKPSELMTEQSKMMYEMGLFEQQLAEDLREAEQNPNLTDQDVEDMFAAANVLRKKKGLDEQTVPDLTRRTLRLKQQQRRAAREAKRQKSETSKQIEEKAR